MPSELRQLKLTELHYHPLVPDTLDQSDFEFIELKNTGQALDIGGVQFTDGITYTFPQKTMLDSGKFVVLASNKVRFTSRYGFSPFGEYTGTLDNSGERIVLLSAQSDTLISMIYSGSSPWPAGADGGGYSLVSKELSPTDDPNDPSYWRLSNKVQGSPGNDDVMTQNVESTTSLTPADFILQQNFPNPFNPETQIRYSVPRSGYISLKLYNLLGQEVATLFEGIRQPGNYETVLNGRGLSSGMYLCRLSANNFSEMKKLILLK
jgi:hypothetical protein